MNKGLRIGLIVVGCLIGFVFVAGIAASFLLPSTNKFLGKSRQTEAKVGLTTAATYLKMDQVETGNYADDGATAFPDSTLFACDSGPCRNYIYAIQKNCEAGAGWNIIDASKVNLQPAAANREAELIAKIEALKLPCKPKATGFTIVAAGIIDEGKPVDIWKIEEKEAPQVIEDSLAK